MNKICARSLSLFVCEAPHAFRLPQEKNVGNFLRIQQKTPPDLPPAFKNRKREAGGFRRHSITRKHLPVHGSKSQPGTGNRAGRCAHTLYSNNLIIKNLNRKTEIRLLFNY